MNRNELHLLVETMIYPHKKPRDPLYEIDQALIDTTADVILGEAIRAAKNMDIGRKRVIEELQELRASLASRKEAEAGK